MGGEWRPPARGADVNTLTAVICTRDRARWTSLAVKSLLDQDVEPDRFDILVVDNGSTDGTVALVRDLAASHPSLRLVSEPVPGLSRARNRGVEHARGDVIAFLDDDAEACPSWARRHLDAFDDDAVVATGGRIVLDWPVARPSWLPPHQESMYSGLDLGDDTTDFEPPRFPFGANMAVRRSVFDSIGGFSTQLGRTGRNLVSGEERELFDRVRQHGGRILYLPDASVSHHVLPDRLGRRWLLRRLYDEGRSKVILDRSASSRRRAYWAGRVGWQVGRGVRFGLQAMVLSAGRGAPTEVTTAASLAAQSFGTARESLRVVMQGRDEP